MCQSNVECKLTGCVQCKNCGHWLWRSNSNHPWEHFTRFYHSNGYPYTSKRCRAEHKVDGFERNEGCTCENPEPLIEVSVS